MPLPTLTRHALLAATLALSLLPAHARALALDPAQDDSILAGVDKFSTGAKESNEVTLDKNMLGMAGGFLAPKLGIMSHNIDSVIIRQYDYAAPGAYKIADVEEVRKRLEGGGWKHLVRTKETTAQGTELTDISVRGDSDNTIQEMVIISAEPTEVSFIHIRGHLTQQDMMMLGARLGLPSTPAPPVVPRPPQ